MRGEEGEWERAHVSRGNTRGEKLGWETRLKVKAFEARSGEAEVKKGHEHSQEEEDPNVLRHAIGRSPTTRAQPQLESFDREPPECGQGMGIHLCLISRGLGPLFHHLRQLNRSKRSKEMRSHLYSWGAVHTVRGSASDLIASRAASFQPRLCFITA